MKNRTKKKQYWRLLSQAVEILKIWGYLVGESKGGVQVVKLYSTYMEEN
jgi:hypothetical protein